jgi:hypothetical protein
LKVGDALVKGGAHTKDQFEGCFLELLGPDAHGLARVTYCIAMTSNGREKQIQFWGTEEERKAYEAAHPQTASRGCAAMLCVLASPVIVWLLIF